MASASACTSAGSRRRSSWPMRSRNCVGFSLIPSMVCWSVVSLLGVRNQAGGVILRFGSPGLGYQTGTNALGLTPNSVVRCTDCTLPSQVSGSLAQRGDLALLSEEHTSELQSRGHLVCRLLLEKK